MVEPSDMSLSELPVVKLVGGGMAFVTGTKSSAERCCLPLAVICAIQDPHMPIAL